MQTFTVTSNHGTRTWQAESAEHAIEQHYDAFPDEPVTAVFQHLLIRGPLDTTTDSKPERLYWSNNDGWVSRDAATVFTLWPLNLPSGTDGLEAATACPGFVDVSQRDFKALAQIENEELAQSIRLGVATLRASTPFFDPSLAPHIDALTRGELNKTNTHSDELEEITNLARNVIVDILLACDHLQLGDDSLLEECEYHFSRESRGRV